MADRIQLPPIAPEVEPLELVRARGESRARLVAAALMVLLVVVGVRGVQLCLSPLDRTVRAAGVQWSAEPHRPLLLQTNDLTITKAIGEHSES